MESFSTMRDFDSRLNREQDIARSTYADMLNDDERNRAYDAAIRLTVSLMVRSPVFNPDGNKMFHCGDIGTGTGLLSMMIVRAFKEMNYESFRITAFEAFEPMARCAHKIIEKNNMSEYITIIPTRSDEVEYFQEENKFDLLVAELLDTELIGEGCLLVYKHAITNLCSKYCLFVPYKANVYIQPVASSSLFARQTIDNYEVGLDQTRVVKIMVPDEVRNCSGLPAIDDLQASQLVNGKDFFKLTKEPILIFEFTFKHLEGILMKNKKEIEVVLCERVTQPPVLIMWWEIIMYPDIVKPSLLPLDELDKSLKIVSCAPTWARSRETIDRDAKIQNLYNREVWREHWIQGVYYFRNIKECRRLVRDNLTSPNDEKITIIANHDSYSMWFDIKTSDSNSKDCGPSFCTCGFHRILTRSQFAFLNDKKEITKLLKSYLDCPHAENTKYPIKACLEFSNERLPFSTRSDWKFTFRTMRNYTILSDLNPLKDLNYHSQDSWKTIYDIMYRQRRFFHQSMDPLIRPSKAPIKHFSIKCTQVQFDNLNRIRMDIDNCEGFDVSEVDKMIVDSSNMVDENVELHYLWEFPCKRLDKDYVIYSSQDNPSENRLYEGTYWKNLELPINCRGPIDWKKGWALVLWCEYVTDNTNEIISTGPIDDNCVLFQKIKWNKHFRQMVYFMHNHPLTQKGGIYCNVSLDVGFNGPLPIVLRAIDYNTSVIAQQ